MTYTPCMCDLYHLDPLSGKTYADDVALFAAAKAAGWPILVHKLSQSDGMIDDKAAGRLAAAVDAGMLIGGYHYMSTTANVSSQIGNFMKARSAIKPPMVLVLDFEPAAASTQAEEMASEIVNSLRMIEGIWPMLYTGRWFVTPIPLDNLPSCPLWLAAYTKVALTNPVGPSGWRAPVWVQYSDGQQGYFIHDVPGVGLVDQSAFNGTMDEAIAWWTANQR